MNLLVLFTDWELIQKLFTYALFTIFDSLELSCLFMISAFVFGKYFSPIFTVFTSSSRFISNFHLNCFEWLVLKRQKLKRGLRPKPLSFGWSSFSRFLKQIELKTQFMRWNDQTPRKHVIQGLIILISKYIHVRI